MIFYSATEAELWDWNITKRSLADIQSTGFDSVYLEYRNVRAGAGSPRFQNWLTRFCEHAAEIGIVVAMDCNVNAVSDYFYQLHPEVYTDPVHHDFYRLENGEFELETTGEPLNWQVEQALLIARGAGNTLTSVQDVTKQLKVLRTHVEGGGCAMTMQRGPSVTKRRFAVEGVSGGELMLISRVRFGYGFRDAGHPEVLAALPHLLERMAGKHRPCAGFMWDEPHFGFAFFPNNGRTLSEHLLGRFEALFGYDLRPRLAELWWNVVGRNSALLRLHYAELLESELAVLEKRFYDLTRQFSAEHAGGNSDFLGMHRTMHEELSDDFYIGCSDYFRHNRFTTGGFTDSVFERDDSMILFFRLAQSLALDSPSGEAWTNNWGFVPTEEHHRYYLPLMGIMNLRWIAHAYHDSIQFGPGYPDSDLWANMGAHLRDHASLLTALEGTRPAADTAIVYNWKTLARYPDNYIHTHRRSLLLLSKQLARQGTQFLIVDDVMLGEAEVEGEEFRTRIGTFKRLILPWCDFLVPEALSALERLAAAGIEIICFGAPAEQTSDGVDVRGRFEALIGAATGVAICVASGTTLELEDQDFTFSPEEVQPNIGSNPASTYADHYKIYPLQNPKHAVLARLKGQNIGVRSGSVRYFGFDFPHCPGVVATVIPGTDLVIPEGALLMQSTDGEVQYFGLCGEYGREMRGHFRCGDCEAELTGERYVLFALQKGGLRRLVCG